jgi:hypothetical protein
MIELVLGCITCALSLVVVVLALQAHRTMCRNLLQLQVHLQQDRDVGMVVDVLVGGE